MFNRLVEQQRPLLIASVEYNNVVLPDFELLKKISKILQPFADKTEKLSSRNECISSILPTYKYLLACLAENALDSTIEKEMKQVISIGLKNRMEEHLDKNFLVISTLVDPRYKNKGSIFNAAQRMRNKLLICSEIVQCLNPVDPMSPAHSFVNGENNDDPMGQFLSAGCEEEHLTTNMADYPNVEEEVDAYFKASTEKLTIDPTEFWKNSSMYPNIKKLARIYLSCPPSSVESERIFSRLSSIENFKRSRLTSQHAKEQLFLLFNFDE